MVLARQYVMYRELEVVSESTAENDQRFCHEERWMERTVGEGSIRTI